MAVHGDRPKVRRMKELGQGGAVASHSNGAAAGHSDGSTGEPFYEAGAEPSDGAAAGHSEGAALEPSYEAGVEPSDGAAAGHSGGAAGEPSYGVAEVRIVDLPPVDNEVTVMGNGDQSLALTPDLGRCTSMISFHSCSHLEHWRKAKFFFLVSVVYLDPYLVVLMDLDPDPHPGHVDLDQFTFKPKVKKPYLSRKVH